MTNIDICRKCHSNNTSCCTVRSDNGEKMMIPPVSNAEMKRILKCLDSQKKSTIFKNRANSSFFIKQMLNLFPGMELSVINSFPKDKTHFELKTQNDACTLLGANGCILPKEARPYFCRIYPFWFLEDDPQMFQDSECLALQNYHTIPEVLLSLGTNPETLKQIHSRICQDWGLSHSKTQAKVTFSL